MIVPDIELLRCYASDGSESGFSEIVRRHLDLVYSTALRRVGGDESMARDISQSVFSDLARKARLLTGRASLSGWLYTSTHYAAAKAVRGEQRRRAREQEAIALHELNTGEANSDWDHTRLILDRAMHELGEKEREALVLRFFERQDLNTVGQALGVSAEAARKRVDRSLDKLRARLAKHGVTSTSTALSLALTGSALASAPVGLAPIITAAALTAAASDSISISTLIKLMTSTKLKIGAASLLVASVATIPLVLQHREVSQLKTEREQTREEIALLRGDLDASNRKMANLLNDYQRQQMELADLRRLKVEAVGLKSQVKDEQTKVIDTSASAPKSNTTPEAEAEKFRQLIGYVAKLRSRHFGAEAQPTDKERKWMEEAKPYFKELLKSPDLFSQLQTSLVQDVLNLTDEAKLNSIRSVIQTSASEAAQRGLLYSANPNNEPDDWKRQRHELDRKATRSVQSLLTDSERSLFDSRFLGALVTDLTPGKWDPTFEYIDPTLRAAAPEQSERAVLERSPVTGTLIPVTPQP